MPNVFDELAQNSEFQTFPVPSVGTGNIFDELVESPEFKQASREPIFTAPAPPRITKENHIQFAADEINQVNERLAQQGQEPAQLVHKQRIIDSFREEAGLSPIYKSKNFFKEGLDIQAKESPLASFSSGVRRPLATTGLDLALAINKFNPVPVPEVGRKLLADKLQELREDVFSTTGEPVGAAGFAGETVAALGTVFTTLAAGPAVIPIFATQGVGSSLAETAAQRKTGVEISDSQEIGAALTTGIVEGASGLITQSIFGRLAPEVKTLIPGIKSAFVKQGLPGVRKFLTASLSTVFKSLAIEVPEEVLTQITTNAISKIFGIDPDKELLEGAKETAIGTIPIALAGGSFTAKLQASRTAGREQRLLGKAALKRTSPISVKETGKQQIARLTKELDAERVLARTDPLTKIPNIRGFKDAIVNATNEADQSGENMTLVLSDIANFKLINDRLGHPVGDRVLLAKVEAIREAIREETADRPGDISQGDFGRIGGDEFQMLLRNVEDPAVVDKVMARANEFFAEKVVEIVGTQLPPEALPFISYGSEVRRANDGRNIEDIAKKADAREKAAKAIQKEERGIPKDRMALEKFMETFDAKQKSELEQRAIGPTLEPSEVIAEIRQQGEVNAEVLGELLADEPHVLVEFPIGRDELTGFTDSDLSADKLGKARVGLEDGTPAPPVVIGKDSTVVDGRHRVLAALDAGAETIAALVPRSIAEAQGLIPRLPAALSGPPALSVKPTPPVKPSEPPLPPGNVKVTGQRPQLLAPNRPLTLDSQTPPKGPTSRDTLGELGPGEHQARFAVPRGIEDLMAPISTRLLNISKPLFLRLQRYELRHRTLRAELERPVMDFLRQKNDILNADQKKRFSLLVSNENFDEAKALLRSVAPTPAVAKELLLGFRSVTDTLNTIHDLAESVGMKVGFRQNYWPRAVKDLAGLKKQLGTEVLGDIEQAVKRTEERKDRELTQAERIEVTNRVLQGYTPRKPGDANPGNFRERTVGEITHDMQSVYHDADRAIMDYINRASTAIEKRRFFGKNVLTEEDLFDSIGSFVDQLVQNGELSVADQRGVIDLLQSRFGPGEMSSGGFVRVMRDVGYITLLANPLAAVTQIGDLFLSAYKNGLVNTTTTALQRKRIKIADLGIERIAAEFMDPSSLARSLQVSMQVSGFKTIDQFGKDVFLNAALNKAENAVRVLHSKEFNKLERKWLPIFGTEFAGVVRDLQQNNITDNVRLLIFMSLTEIQPITLTEMPKKYLDAPNGRIFYTLKTFWIKQLDVVRRDAFHKINTGDIKGGFGDLARFYLLFGMGNILADLLKKWILGEKITVEDMPDIILDNSLRVFGGSKFLLNSQMRDGLARGFLVTLLPPTNIVDDVGRDLLKLPDIITGEDSLSSIRSLRNIPVIGKFMYFRFGKGKEILAKREHKKQTARRTQARTLAKKAILDGDLNSARAFVNQFNQEIQGEIHRITGEPLKPLNLGDINKSVRQAKKKAAQEALRVTR